MSATYESNDKYSYHSSKPNSNFDIKTSEISGFHFNGHAILQKSKKICSSWYSGIDHNEYQTMKQLKGVAFATRMKRCLEQDSKFKIHTNRRIKEILEKLKNTSLSYLYDEYIEYFHPKFMNFLEKKYQNAKTYCRSSTLANYLLYILASAYEFKRKQKAKFSHLNELKESLGCTKHSILNIKLELKEVGILNSKSSDQLQNLAKNTITENATQLAFKLSPYLPSHFTAKDLIDQFSEIITTYKLSALNLRFSPELVSLISYLQIMKNYSLPNLRFFTTIITNSKEEFHSLYQKIYRMKYKNKQFEKLFSAVNFTTKTSDSFLEELNKTALDNFQNNPNTTSHPESIDPNSELNTLGIPNQSSQLSINNFVKKSKKNRLIAYAKVKSKMPVVQKTGEASNNIYKHALFPALMKFRNYLCSNGFADYNLSRLPIVLNTTALFHIGKIIDKLNRYTNVNNSKITSNIVSFNISKVQPNFSFYLLNNICPNYYTIMIISFYKKLISFYQGKTKFQISVFDLFYIKCFITHVAKFMDSEVFGSGKYCKNLIQKGYDLSSHFGNKWIITKLKKGSYFIVPEKHSTHAKMSENSRFTFSLIAQKVIYIYLYYCIYRFLQLNFTIDYKNKNSTKTFKNSRMAQSFIYEINTMPKFTSPNVFGCAGSLILLLYYKYKKQILSFLRESNNLEATQHSSNISAILSMG